MIPKPVLLATKICYLAAQSWLRLLYTVMKRLYSEPCGLTWRDRLTCEGKYPSTPAAWAVQLIPTGPSWQCYPSACWLAPIFPSSLSTVSIFPSICEVYLLQLLSQTSTSEPWLVDFLPRSWPHWSSDVWVQLSWVRFLCVQNLFTAWNLVIQALSSSG